MKIAENKRGEQIIATSSAPKEARCPYCGGILNLRSRRTMNNGEVTYYWRHGSNRDVRCSARRRPMR